MSIKKIFGKNIKYYRYKLGYSQEKLSEILNMNTSYLSQIETGNHNITFDRIIEIAEALKIEPQLLFENKKNNNNIPDRITDFKR